MNPSILDVKEGGWVVQASAPSSSFKSQSPQAAVVLPSASLDCYSHGSESFLDSLLPGITLMPSILDPIGQSEQI